MWPRYTVYQLHAGLHGPDIQYISSAQACMASIYSISAPRRLAWPRYTVYQPRAGLQGPVEHFASSKQACRGPSKSSPASSRLAGPRRSLRQRHAGLRGPVEVFASVKRAWLSYPAGRLGWRSVVGTGRRIVRRNLSLSTLQTKEETDL